jgi:hypothetical protein
MVRGWSVAVAGLLLVPALAACSSDDAPDRATAGPTPLAKLHVASLRLARAEFCDQVPKVAVRRALGGPPTTDASWGNGDPVDGEGGTGDVGHEIGCSWTATTGASVRAWVFARSVTAAFAATLQSQESRQRGCTVTPTKVLGDPALLQACTLPGGVHRLRRAGLVGDTWLTCEVSGEPTGLRARMDAWCAQVVAALDTP